jgi:hypothetical protein
VAAIELVYSDILILLPSGTNRLGCNDHQNFNPSLLRLVEAIRTISFLYHQLSSEQYDYVFLIRCNYHDC